MNYTTLNIRIAISSLRQSKLAELADCYEIPLPFETEETEEVFMAKLVEAVLKDPIHFT